MKLRMVRIGRFRAIKSREIAFEDDLGRIRPVTVLAGPNGCGKTSVLFAIVQGLRGLLGYRTDDVPTPTDQDIHRAGAAGGLSATPPSASVDLDLQFDEAELEAIPQVFADTAGVVHNEPALRPIEGGRVEIQWRYPPPRKADGTLRPYWHVASLRPGVAMSWFHGRRYAIRGWQQRALRSADLIEQVGGIHLFPQDRNLLLRVVGAVGQVPVHEAEPDAEDELEEQQRRARDPRSVWGILHYLSDYSRERGDLHEQRNWEKRIKQQFSRICSPREYLGYMYQQDDPVGAPYFKNGDSVYPLNMAASGEQVIIEYLTRLTYPSPKNYSIVLIDEPELHLHPGWIRQLYHALPMIGVNNQYILTTHSAELRAMAAEDGALIDMGELEGRH